MNFSDAVMKLWPNGDQIIKGLRAGMIQTAPQVFAKYGITDSLVLAHFMAQMSHECGAGHEVIENLNYSAKRMTQVWPSRFPSLADAAPYEHNPKKLANKVYNGRMGNRVGTDDGWNFRGRGGVQTTGRDGYEQLKKDTGLDVVKQPDLVIDPQYFMECAAADFVACGCVPYAVKDDIRGVTKKLNGGTVGLAERDNWLAKWKAAKVPVPKYAAPAASPVQENPVDEDDVEPTTDPSVPVADDRPWWKRMFG